MSRVCVLKLVHTDFPRWNLIRTLYISLILFSPNQNILYNKGMEVYNATNYILRMFSKHKGQFPQYHTLQDT